jgi:hypothetical protein
MNQRYNLVILAGGKWERLWKETKLKPKAMVDLGWKPLIQHCIEYFRSKADIAMLTIGLWYKGDSVEKHLWNGQYQVPVNFCKESEDDLVDTGNSFCKIMSEVRDKIPMIVTFCDYLYRDWDVDVKRDGLWLFQKSDQKIPHWTFKTLWKVEKGRIVWLENNPNLDELFENWFNGLFVAHDVTLVKSICHEASANRKHINYAKDVVLPYLWLVETSPIYLRSIFECWDLLSLKQTRELCL